MCRHYAPTAPDGCDEEDAIDVRDKTAANFCDYFDPNPNAFDGSERRAEDAARAKLDALFGSDEASDTGNTGESEADQLLGRAEDLFK